jgi:hypothetical protein
MPLTNTSVNLAGQPSKVGGTVARVFGWVLLGGGWLLAALFAGLIVLLGGGWAALAVAAPIALIASVIAYALLRGGKQLQKSGDDAELATKNQAIFALANARNGVLKAWDVAQMLHVSPKEGDDILTKLAKEHPDHVSVDVDDDGNVLYRFPSTVWGGLPQMAPNAPNVRVQVPAGPPPVRVETREPLPPEEIEAEAARQKAR